MKFLSFILFACATLLSSVKVDGRNWPNPGRKLACWPEKLKFQNFKMEVHFSTTRKKDQVVGSIEDFKSRKIDFDPKQRTAIIIHGLTGQNHANLMKKVRNALLHWKDDMNVIILHWEHGSWTPLLYHNAAINTEFASLELSNFLNELAGFFKKTKNIDRSEWGPLHLIGYSMGAHVAGQAAAFLRRDYNWLVDRVTGLDPSEPCFEDADNPLRLNRTNARFVDVIHTDGARFRNGAYGLLDKSGHADFYVNGGSVQPGCGQSVIENKSISIDNYNLQYPNYVQLIIHTFLDRVCSHERSVWLFIESLKQAKANTCQFWGRPWRLGTSAAKTKVLLQNECDANTCPQLGINAESYNYENTLGSFYVATTSSKPFCNV